MSETIIEEASPSAEIMVCFCQSKSHLRGIPSWTVFGQSFQSNGANLPLFLVGPEYPQMKLFFKVFLLTTFKSINP